MVIIKKENYQGWEAYRLENDYLKMLFLPQVGGRIISFSNKGDELLYTMPKARGKVYDLDGIDNIKEYRKELEYTPVGGYKTWLAPQFKWDWPPYLDLAVGDYKFDYQKEEDKIICSLISPICRETGMQLIREFILTSNSEQLEVRQRMKNLSLEEKEFGLWDVTQVQGEGKVIFPIYNLDDIDNLLDENGKEFISTIELTGQLYAIVECNSQAEFKVGTASSAGWVLSVVTRGSKKVGYLKRFPIFTEVKFGHGYAIEVFDTYKYDYFEVEVHGPLVNLAEQEENSFTEEWEIYNFDQNMELEGIIKSINIKG